MEKDVQTNMGTPAPEGVIQPTTPVVQPSEPVNTPIQPMPTQQPMVNGGINPTTPVAPMAPQAPQGGGLAGLKAKLFSHGVGPVVAAVVVILLLVAGVSYKMITSSPKNVFKGAINSAYKDVDAAFTAFDEFTETYNFEEKAIVVDFDTTLDTNVKEITEITDQLGFKLKDVTVGVTAGIDYKDEKVLAGGYIKGEKEKIDATMMLEDGIFYIGTSLLEDVLKYQDKSLDIDFSELKEMIESAEISTDVNDYRNAVKSIKDAFIASISNEYTEKESDELEIAGKKVKVTKNSLVLDEDSLEYMMETIAEELEEDDEFLKSAAAIGGVDKKEIKEALKMLKESASEIEESAEVKINIYTKGFLNTYAGFGLEVEGKEYLTYVVDGDDFELVYDDQYEDYGTKVVVSVKDTKLTAKVNGEKIFTGTVKEISDEKIDFTIKSALEELPLEISYYYDVKGKFEMSMDLEIEGTKVGLVAKVNEKAEDKKVAGDYELKLTADGEIPLDSYSTIKLDDAYISAKGKYSIEATDNLDTLNTKNAKDITTMTDADMENLEKTLLDNLNKVAENDAVFKAIKTYAEEAAKEMANQTQTPDYDYDYDYDYDMDDYDDLYSDMEDYSDLYGDMDTDTILGN